VSNHVVTDTTGTGNVLPLFSSEGVPSRNLRRREERNRHGVAQAAGTTSHAAPFNRMCRYRYARFLNTGSNAMTLL